MGVLTGLLTRRCSGAPVEGWGWPRVAEASAGLSPLQREAQQCWGKYPACRSLASPCNPNPNLYVTAVPVTLIESSSLFALAKNFSILSLVTL